MALKLERLVQRCSISSLHLSQVIAVLARKGISRLSLSRGRESAEIVTFHSMQLSYADELADLDAP